MKAQPVEKLVHEHLFPRARATDPDNFLAFVNRHLLSEVRAETQAFYGHLDTQESKYPGLDYNHRIHRIRLSRYPWHRRLFRAFDALGLTPAEISNLTRWEGTKWAKEKYEEEHGVKILGVPCTRGLAKTMKTTMTGPEAKAAMSLPKASMPAARVKNTPTTRWTKMTTRMMMTTTTISPPTTKPMGKPANRSSAA
jgi:hypothetical protein